MQNILIVTGGEVSIPLLKEVVAGLPDFYLIGVDRGTESLLECGLKPDLMLGDFDSAKADAVSFFESENVNEIRLNPIKDNTDTEEAIDYVLVNFPKVPVTIIGATGTRVDHMLSTFALMKKAYDAGTVVTVIDPHNRIRVFTGNITIKKSEQYGGFFSVIPYDTDLDSVTISGAKYNIENVTIPRTSGLGVSNEIVADQARISIGDGVAYLIESKD